jgi:predicted SnoaL-like aldol condensation-catalyzing enzyme
MSHQNKEIARRFVQAFATGNVAVLEQIVAEDVVDHTLPPGASRGRRGLLDAVATCRVGFPDMEISIEREVAEGDSVVVYMYRIVNGRIIETRTSPGCSNSWAFCAADPAVTTPRHLSNRRRPPELCGARPPI